MKNFTSALVMSLLISTASFSQPGTLDSSFSKDGILKTKIESRSYAFSAAIQPDGKIVVAGWSENVNNFDFTLARYGQNGIIDSGFGINGIVATDFGGNEACYSVALQADGKIVVGGTYGIYPNHDFVTVRYKSYGKIDSAFGVNGKVITDFGGTDDIGLSIAMQSDGKILEAGYSGGSSKFDFALVRYRSNGALDSSFGDRGKVLTDFGESEYGNSVAIQTDGKIIVAGTSSPNSDFVLARYKPNGKLDGNFGNKGKVRTDFGGFDFGYSVAIQSDGKILVGGYTDNGFALVRYKTNGAPDSSFGTNGKVINTFGEGDLGYSVAVQPDGKILMGGSASGENFLSDFALVRYKPNGKLDSSFGENGIGMAEFGNSADGKSIAIQPDGKIVLAGVAGRSFALARFNGNNTSAANDKNNNFSNLKKQNNTSSNIHLSPNPVKDILHIEGLSSLKKTISVVDAKGKLLQQTTTANNTYSFNVKQLNAGMYFIKIDGGDKTTALKFIKE